MMMLYVIAIEIFFMIMLFIGAMNKMHWAMNDIMLMLDVLAEKLDEIKDKSR